MKLHSVPARNLKSGQRRCVSFNMSHVWTFAASSFSLCLCFNSVGQLSVEGGSRAYTEGVARPAILRPQPVPCVSVPSLCYPVRETDCSYQSFCQHQLCCLHCRPAPSVPLEKYPHPLDKYSVPHAQEPSCSSPPSLQGRWNADAAAQAHPSQNSTRAESARRTPAPETPGEFQPRSGRERPTDQLQDSGDTDSGEERRVSAQADEDRVSRRRGQRRACVHRALQRLHH